MTVLALYWIVLGARAQEQDGTGAGLIAAGASLLVQFALLLPIGVFVVFRAKQQGPVLFAVVMGLVTVFGIPPAFFAVPLVYSVAGIASAAGAVLLFPDLPRAQRWWIQGLLLLVALLLEAVCYAAVQVTEDAAAAAAQNVSHSFALTPHMRVGSATATERLGFISTSVGLMLLCVGSVSLQRRLVQRAAQDSADVSPAVATLAQLFGRLRASGCARESDDDDDDDGLQHSVSVVLRPMFASLEAYDAQLLKEQQRGGFIAPDRSFVKILRSILDSIDEHCSCFISSAAFELGAAVVASASWRARENPSDDERARSSAAGPFAGGSSVESWVDGGISGDASNDSGESRSMMPRGAEKPFSDTAAMSSSHAMLPAVYLERLPFCTVMRLRIVNYDALFDAAAGDPSLAAAVSAAAADLHRALHGIISSLGGRVAGDEHTAVLTAFWARWPAATGTAASAAGHPAVAEHMEVLACIAALRCAHIVKKQQQQQQEHDHAGLGAGSALLPSLSLAIGVHCGSALVGNVGSETARATFAVLGEAVDVADRLSSTRRFGGPSRGAVLVSDDVVRAAAPSMATVFTAHGLFLASHNLGDAAANNGDDDHGSDDVPTRSCPRAFLLLGFAERPKVGRHADSLVSSSLHLAGFNAEAAAAAATAFSSARSSAPPVSEEAAAAPAHTAPDAPSRKTVRASDQETVLLRPSAIAAGEGDDESSNKDGRPLSVGSGRSSAGTNEPPPPIGAATASQRTSASSSRSSNSDDGDALGAEPDAAQDGGSNNSGGSVEVGLQQQHSTPLARKQPSRPQRSATKTIPARITAAVDAAVAAMRADLTLDERGVETLRSFNILREFVQQRMVEETNQLCEAMTAPLDPMWHPLLLENGFSVGAVRGLQAECVAAAAAVSLAASAGAVLHQSQLVPLVQLVTEPLSASTSASAQLPVMALASAQPEAQHEVVPTPSDAEQQQQPQQRQQHYFVETHDSGHNTLAEAAPISPVIFGDAATSFDADAGNASFSSSSSTSVRTSPVAFAAVSAAAAAAGDSSRIPVLADGQSINHAFAGQLLSSLSSRTQNTSAEAYAASDSSASTTSRSPSAPLIAAAAMPNGQFAPPYFAMQQPQQHPQVFPVHHLVGSNGFTIMMTDPSSPQYHVPMVQQDRERRSEKQAAARSLPQSPPSSSAVMMLLTPSQDGIEGAGLLPDDAPLEQMRLDPADSGPRSTSSFSSGSVATADDEEEEEEEEEEAHDDGENIGDDGGNSATAVQHADPNQRYVCIQAPGGAMPTQEQLDAILLHARRAMAAQLGVPVHRIRARAGAAVHMPPDPSQLASVSAAAISAMEQEQQFMAQQRQMMALYQQQQLAMMSQQQQQQGT